MRLGLISFLILMGCGREDPAMEIVRLPQTAYGPFDAASEKPVASDAAADSEPKVGVSTQVECYVPEALGEDEESADAPFDNCPTKHDGGRFNEKATSQRRARNTDMCCYTVVHRKTKVITLPPIG